MTARCLKKTIVACRDSLIMSPIGLDENVPLEYRLLKEVIHGRAFANESEGTGTEVGI